MVLRTSLTQVYIIIQNYIDSIKIHDTLNTHNNALKYRQMTIIHLSVHSCIRIHQRGRKKGRKNVNIELDLPRIESRRAASQFMDAGGPRLILNVLSAPAASAIFTCETFSLHSATL